MLGPADACQQQEMKWRGAPVPCDSRIQIFMAGVMGVANEPPGHRPCTFERNEKKKREKKGERKKEEGERSVIDAL